MSLILIAVLMGAANAQKAPGFTFNINRLNNSMAQIETHCEVGLPKVLIPGAKPVSKKSFAHKFEIGTHEITGTCGIRSETKKFSSAGDSSPAGGLKSGILSVKIEKGRTALAQFTVIGTCEPFELSWGDTSSPLIFEGIETSSPGATCLSDVVTKKAKHTYTANGEYQMTLKAGGKTSYAKAKINNAVKE